MRNRILAFIIAFIFIFSMMISPAFAAPPNPNHTITVNGSGFDGSEAELNFNLIGGSEILSGTISSSNTSTDFSNLDSGTYSIDVVSITEGYEVDIEPQSIKLVGRDKSGVFTISLSGGVIEDTEPPVINILGANPYILEGGDDYVEPGYEVTDNVDSPENISLEINGQIDNYTPGTYTLTYTATDLSGNSSTATRIVEVVDTTAPVITLIGSDTVTITEGDTYTDEGATAYDIVDGDITGNIIKTGEVNTSIVGTYYITYNVSDAAGNPAEEVTRTVIVQEEAVEDTEPPVITLLGANPYILEGGDDYLEPGYEVSDNVDSPEEISVVASGEIDNFTPGSYTLTYTATDLSGNSSTATRTVEVVDTTAPVITLIGSETVTITEGDTYTDEGATAYDIVDGDITDNIVKTGTVDTLTVGTYYINYNVSDAAGNAAEEVIRTVTVEAAVVNPTIHYLALGDSIATGTTGISGTMYTYAYQFRDYLGGIYGDNLTYNNLAVDGDDAGELLYRLNNDSTYIAEVENADIITLSIGGNNIMDAARDSSFWEIDTGIAEAGTSAFEIDYPALIARIRYLNPDVEIISMTLYNPYNSANHPTGYSDDEELHNIGQQYIGRINDTMRSISDSNYKIADVYSSFYAYGEIGKMGDVTFFYPRYSWWTWWYVKLTRDPHPNQTGQDIIRDLFIEAYESPLSYNTLDMKYLA